MKEMDMEEIKDQETRICKACGESKILNSTNFEKQISSIGKECFRHKCKTCKSAYQKNYKIEKCLNLKDEQKQAIIVINDGIDACRDILGIKKCKICGEDKTLNKSNFKYQKDNSGIGIYFKPLCRMCENILDQERSRKRDPAAQKRYEERLLKQQKDNENLRICSKCREEKELNIENFAEVLNRKNEKIFSAQCRECGKEACRNWSINNKWYFDTWNINNVEKRKTSQKKYREVHKEELKDRTKNKRKNDISYKLRCDISRAISKKLKRNGGSKNGESFINAIPYSIKELKAHIEAQFVGENSWMSWDKLATYNKNTWDDNDKNSWVFNIDHIIPASLFKPKSLYDSELINCFALENLRPLSAKQNIIDGASKVRHKLYEQIIEENPEYSQSQIIELILNAEKNNLNK
jgi:hypothetical protein